MAAAPPLLLKPPTTHNFTAKRLFPLFVSRNTPGPSEVHIDINLRSDQDSCENSREPPTWDSILELPIYESSEGITNPTQIDKTD